MHRAITLSIDPELLIQFPELQLGGFIATGVERASQGIAEELHELTRASAGTLAFEHAARFRPVVATGGLTTLCRAVALRYLVALTGYDLEALPSPDITIRAALPGTDWFVPLGARTTDAPLRRSVIVHAAGPVVLSRAFNDRESRQTCLTADTRSAVFVTDAVSSEQARAAAAGLEDLRVRLANRGAEVGTMTFVDAWTPRAELRCARTALRA